MAIVYNLFISLLAIMWTHIECAQVELTFAARRSFFCPLAYQLRWKLKVFFSVCSFSGLFYTSVENDFCFFLCSDAIIRPMTDDNSEVIVMKNVRIMMELRLLLLFMGHVTLTLTARLIATAALLISLRKFSFFRYFEA